MLNHQQHNLHRPQLQRLSLVLAAATTVTCSMQPLPAGAVPTADKHQAISPIIDPLGRPSPEVLREARRFADQPFVPHEVRDAVSAAITFYEGADTAGVPLPSPAITGAFTQFYWPTIAGQCIGGTGNSVGSAIAVPGPAPLPLPGVSAGHTAFVFTALGTEPLAPHATHHMRVRWVNITSGSTGVTQLSDTGINPDGPATLNGIGATGHGTVIAMLDGNLTTTAATCSFFPTAAIFHVS